MYGQLGYKAEGRSMVQKSPKKVTFKGEHGRETHLRYKHIACGARHSAAISVDYDIQQLPRLWAWGQNDCGQCGSYSGGGGYDEKLNYEKLSESPPNVYTPKEVRWRRRCA